MSDEMLEGQRVEVRLHGDDQWYHGIVLEKPRKMWVQLEDYGQPMIADENNIVEWRPERASIRPLREFITVRPAPAALSAIIDTSALKDDMMVGEVLAVGSGMRLKGNKVRPMCVKPGERVRFRLRSAKAWHDPMLKDVMLIQEDDVLGIEPREAA